MQVPSHRRKRSTLLAVLIAVLVFVLLVAFVAIDLFSVKPASEPKVFIGVDVAYGDANTIYNVADAMSGHANLIIIGSTDVTSNTTELTDVCNFLYQKGFYFIVYVGFASVGYFPPEGPDSMFFQMAVNRWGEKFLGAYLYDESGGKQLDLPLSSPDKPVSSASSYSDAAIHFIINMGSYLSIYKDTYYGMPQMKLFTSDYGLYWYDYLSGYDVVLAEFTGTQNNQSKQLTVSLERGAAESQGKEWGGIITFSSQVPVLENATQLYNDLILMWENDAKYMVVFDSPGPNQSATTPYGILTTDQLNSIKNFYNYAKNHEEPKQDPAQTAYVLPMDYGYGFNGPNDTIWGLWPADALSPKIWDDTNNLLTSYGMKLDIVYETRTGNIPISLPYKILIFWNGTTVQQ